VRRLTDIWPGHTHTQALEQFLSAYLVYRLGRLARLARGNSLIFGLCLLSEADPLKFQSLVELLHGIGRGHRLRRTHDGVHPVLGGPRLHSREMRKSSASSLVQLNPSRPSRGPLSRDAHTHFRIFSRATRLDAPTRLPYAREGHSTMAATRMSKRGSSFISPSRTCGSDWAPAPCSS
jgi:hypothetical protein